MSSTKNILPVQSISGDMASDITGAAIPIKFLDNVGIHVIWAGTPTGTFSVECSIDGVTYDALTFSSTLTAPSGSAGSFLIDLNELPFYFVRLKYTASSGSGTLTAKMGAKVI